MMELSENFADRLQERIAFLAIGRSALRNQGPAGIIHCARKFCAALPLSTMAKKWNSGRFGEYLNRITRALKKMFPVKARNNFGAARKALNLFFRDVVYNTFLAKFLKLNLQPAYTAQLEIPLDSFTTKRIWAWFPELKQTWTSIRDLEPAVNRQFQEAAALIAERVGTKRVHLDVYYWRQSQK